MKGGKRRSGRALRGKLYSPDRPGVAMREERRHFWTLIAAGLSSEGAETGVAVSQAVGSRWLREAGGMPPSTLRCALKPPSGRYPLVPAARRLGLGRAGLCLRALNRSPSSVEVPAAWADRTSGPPHPDS